jgi:hypothetical protein
MNINDIEFLKETEKSVYYHKTLFNAIKENSKEETSFGRYLDDKLFCSIIVHLSKLDII